MVSVGKSPGFHVNPQCWCNSSYRLSSVILAARAPTHARQSLPGLCMFVGCRWLGHFANVSSSVPAQTNQIVVIGRASIWQPFLSFAVFLVYSCVRSAHPPCNCLGRQGRKVHEIMALFQVLLVHDHGFACIGVQCERSKRASGGNMCWWDAFQTGV